MSLGVIFSLGVLDPPAHASDADIAVVVEAAKGETLDLVDARVKPAPPTVVRVEPAREVSPGTVRAIGGGTGGCPAGMAPLPSGSFTMRHTGRAVRVSSFCMDVTEVTVDAYRSCVQSGKCTAAGTGSPCNWSESGRGDHPINCVDWKQATAYCADVGKRLPTEEEWEWAARGAERRTTYPWGNDAPGSQVCWNGEGIDTGKGSRTSTCPAGAHPRGESPQGIHDLAGNVWEWTSSNYDASGSGRVYRGGGWDDVSPGNLRADYRLPNDPASQDTYLGFRCVRTR